MAEEAKKDDKPKGKKKKWRMHLLDELRGLAVFCMIFYHAFFSLGYIFNVQWGVYLTDFFMPAEPYFAGLFIFISGMACNLSRSNLERGVKLGIIALGVSLATYIASVHGLISEENIISFGILHMLAICMIVYGLIHLYLKFVPIWLGMTFNILLFIFLYHLQVGSVGVPFLFSWNVPKEWYTTDFLFMIGLPSKEFTSGDYFPLIPWFFLFFTGAFFGRLIPQKKFPKWAAKKRVPPLAFLGRHALLLYLAHQPVIFGICWLVQWTMSLFHPAQTPNS